MVGISILASIVCGIVRVVILAMSTATNNSVRIGGVRCVFVTFLRVIQTPIQKRSPRSSPTTYFSDSSYGPLPLAAIMSEIITCPCGAKVRLPEQTANRAFRCPQCKNGIALTLDAQVLASMPLKARRHRLVLPDLPVGDRRRGSRWSPAPSAIRSTIASAGRRSAAAAPTAASRRRRWKRPGHVATPDRLGRYQEVSGLRRNDQVDRREMPLLPDRVRHRQPAFAGATCIAARSERKPKRDCSTRSLSSSPLAC